MKTLILGGTRSGKSNYAEQLVLKSDLTAVYIATATADDAEMQTRIKSHVERRGTKWKTVEEPIELIKTLQQECKKNNYVLVDCLTLWLNNLLLTNERKSELDKINIIEQEIKILCEVIKSMDSDIVFVSNEVGLGIIPMNKLSRQFADLAGLLHQQLAIECEQVILMVAGIPQKIKS